MGSLEDFAFETEIKKWPTDELITILSKNSIHYIQHREDQFMKNYYIEEPVVQNSPNLKKKPIKTFLAPWDMITIEYYSVLFSSDYKKSRQSTISNLVSRFQNSIYLESIASSVTEDPDNLFFYLFGMSAEQFNLQTPSIYLSAFNRNYHILSGSEKIRRHLSIEISDIIMQTIGISIEDFMKSILLIFACCLHNPNPHIGFYYYFREQQNNLDIKRNFDLVLALYTTDYLKIRSSKYGRKQLEITPFIKTQKDSKIVMSSLLSVFQMVGNSLYWLVRNIFYSKAEIQQEFTNAFGLMFEDYIIEYCEYYDFPIEKIPEQKYKSVDLKFENEDFLVLIEVKSLLLNLLGRNQNPNIEDLKLFYKRGIGEASEQIESTLRNIENPQDKRVISLILLYDSLFAADFLLNIDLERFKKNNMFVVGIDSFENWVVLLSKNKEAFNQMLSNLQYREDPRDNRGFSKTLENYKEYFHVPSIPEWDYFHIFLNMITTNSSQGR